MKKGRNVYLNMKTLAEARKILFDSFSLTDVLQTEVVPVSESIGRVLAEPVLAKITEFQCSRHGRYCSQS
jgi:molybdopterin biosynthesis enzyme